MTCLFYSTKKFFFCSFSHSIQLRNHHLYFFINKNSNDNNNFFLAHLFCWFEMEKNSFFFHFILLFFSISPTLTQFPDYLYQTQIGIVRIDIYIFVYFHINTSCVNFLWFSYTQHTHTVISNQNKKKKHDPLFHCYIYTIFFNENLE